MAQLFKKNIVKEQLQNFEIPDFDEKLNIVKKWHDYYHNGTLKTDKEISVASGFTQDFLGEILDYVRKPAENHTYDTEYSIAGQRPDFVLGYLNIKKSFIIGELKDAKTSLDAPQKREGSISPIQQAFKYKGGLRDSSFVIVSNFFETRLYYDNHLDFEVWTLDDLVKPENNYFNFRKFYYLLCEKNLIAKKGDSNTKSLLSLIRIQEKEITKQFYKEYTILRKELFKNIVSNNSFKKSELDFVLNKTQKIIDRIIFIHFCEDLGLLPNGKLNEVVKYGEQSLNTTWETLQNFFRAVDKGSDKLGIPDGYNGGLFHHDEDLNNLKIGDKICKKFVELGEYDFEDDLSVNILGHIFEQSISDIEELKDKINKEEEVSLSKRKKDGVFYTPEYIVDYIVKNSVGKKIDDWETELKEKHKLKEDITDKNYEKRAILVYEELQEKVHNIKIIDPACGSGAFLVKVFDYLLDKNKEIANKLQDLSGSNAMSMFQTEAYFRDILKNNIYGVDLNEESVEISKLSLWLKTASKGKKLANLDGNIKCGNSLIDDKEIAGDKAFVWETEFKDIFDNGGFDVVVGNPPYLRVQGLQAYHKEDVKFYEDNYISSTGNYDIYILFVEKAQKLLKKDGKLGFILPHKFTNSDFGEGMRKVLSKNTLVEKIISFGQNLIFENVSTYTCLLFINRSIKQNLEYLEFSDLNSDSIEIGQKLISLQDKDFAKISYSKLSEKSWTLTDEKTANILDKINAMSLKIGDVFEKIFQGIATSGDKVYLIELEKNGVFVKGFSEQLKKEVEIESGLLKPILKGEDIKKYAHLENRYFVIFPYLIENGKATEMTEEYIKNNFPKGYEYLKENEDFLRGREKGKMDKKGWFLYIYPKSLTLVDVKKIASPDITLGMQLTVDNYGFCIKNGGYGIIIKEEYQQYDKLLLALINSSLMWYFLKNTGTILRGGYFRFNTKYINPFGIPNISKINNQKLFIEKADFMLDKNKELGEKVSKFLKRLNGSFEIDKLSNKLKNFYELEFSEFVKELKKKKVSMSLVQQDEWEEYFDSYKSVIVDLKSEIDICDSEIDDMVFDLYGLSDEERKVVKEV